MRAAAIIFILLSVTANFYFNNLSSLVLAMFSFPVLIGLLLRKKKPGTKERTETTVTKTEPTNSPLV